MIIQFHNFRRGGYDTWIAPQLFRILGHVSHPARRPARQRFGNSQVNPRRHRTLALLACIPHRCTFAVIHGQGDFVDTPPTQIINKNCLGALDAMRSQANRNPAIEGVGAGRKLSSAN
jgi:hypothetical protein